MNDIKFSIIIPCYNVDKYISACLDSILNQDIDNQSVELICIDDCSTDNTLRILEKYASSNKLAFVESQAVV